MSLRNRWRLPGPRFFDLCAKERERERSVLRSRRAKGRLGSSATRDARRPERTSRAREVGKAHFDGPLCHRAIPFEIRRRRELCYRGV